MTQIQKMAKAIENIKDGKLIEIVYQTYSRRGTVKRSGDILRNFVIDKDCDLIAL